MALYVKTKSGAERQWHLGQKRLYNDDLRVVNEVSYIQADGDELERIRYIFGLSIPMSNQVVMTWTGCLAHTILINL